MAETISFDWLRFTISILYTNSKKKKKKKKQQKELKLEKQ